MVITNGANADIPAVKYCWSLALHSDHIEYRIYDMIYSILYILYGIPINAHPIKDAKPCNAVKRLRTLLVFGIDSGLLQLQLQRLHSELSSTELTCLWSKWLLSTNPRCWLFRKFKLIWLPSKRKVPLQHALDWQLMITHLTREVLQFRGRLCKVFWSGSTQHQLVIETPNNPNRIAGVLYFLHQWLVFWCSLQHEREGEKSERTACCRAWPCTRIEM